MSTYINGSNTQNLFYFKEYIDKDKLISKILTNIESKIKVVEEFKNKYYNSNNILENVIMSKFEFLEILNEFEETITQSLQGMRSLMVEIRNLKEKKEIEDKLIKKRNKEIKNKTKDISKDLNNLCYNYEKDKNYSQFLEYNDNKENIEEQIKDKNKSFCEPKEISLYTNMYGWKNNLNLKNNKYNGTKNKLYYKRYSNCSSDNMPSISIKKSINNNNHIGNINDISEYESQNSYEDITKLLNNKNPNLNKFKTYNKFKKHTVNDSMTEKDILTYDLSLINDLGKDNQNHSYIINHNNNEFDNNNKEQKNKIHRRILRLQLKNKNNNININNNKDVQNKNKNNSFSQKYELELQNTNQEKNEKIEVEIKCPIRQGIRQNCRKNSAKNIKSKNDIINRFNYNKNKQEIIEKINKNEKLKNYFAQKYGGKNFDLFLNKFWKNKLNINDINNEVNIISTVIKKEENLDKNKNKEQNFIESNSINNINNYNNLPHKKNCYEYEFKFLSKTPVQNIISKKGSNGNKNYRTITPDKNIDNKYFNKINI